MLLHAHVFTMNLAEEDAQVFAPIMSCKLGVFPLNYLGVRLHHSKLRKEDLQPIIDKSIKKAAGWKGRLLSHSSKLDLVKSVLVSIPIDLLSVIKFPKWAIFFD